MDALSPIFAVAALVTALFTCRLIVKLYGAPFEQGRSTTIDGLRGYLAFFVFIHHSSVWYFYLRTGEWKLPSSALTNLYLQFGQGSVALFFMITGFLFFQKIIYAGKREIDWLRLYVSRLLRISPLYYFAIIIFFMMVAVLSDFTVREPAVSLLKNAAIWLGFTIYGAPTLNQVSNTTLLLGVAWTLRYEWLFYWALPLFALVMRRKVPVVLVALSASAITAVIFTWRQDPFIAVLFSGGIAAAFLARSEVFRDIAVRPFSSLVALACIFITFFLFDTSTKIVPLALLSIAFAIMASGNTMFGLLTNAVSRTLGEISYSIYLLHDFVLFIAFYGIIGRGRAASFSPLEHWFVVLGCIPVLIPASFAAYSIIEAPAMRKVDRLSSWIRSWAGPRAMRRAGDPVPFQSSIKPQ